jgi:hypothetical protein
MPRGFDFDQLEQLVPKGFNEQEKESSQGLIKAEKESESLEQQSKRLKNERYSQDTGNRGLLIAWGAATVTIWLIAVFILLFLNKKSVFLSDSVLITLLGTTTVNVLGLMYIVLRDLFNGTREQ